MKTKTARVSALMLLALAGCGADFDPGSHVNSLRVLSVQVDNPYAAPGETVRFEATSYDPEGRTVEWAWVACETPDSASVDGCLIEIAETAAATGGIPLLASGPDQNSAELTIPADVLDGIPAEARPGVLSGVLSIACPGTLSLDLEGEQAQSLLPFRCVDAASGKELGLHDTIVGVKRVFIRETDRNQNPVIESVTFDGEVWPEDEVKEVDSCDTSEFTFDDCKGEGEHRIAAILAPESFESGTDEFGREFDEELIVQHYATEGIFEYEIRIGELPDNRWVARRRASGDELLLWFVARDDRGGVAIAERRVAVR